MHAKYSRSSQENIAFVILLAARSIPEVMERQKELLKTVKSLLKKEADPYLALLSYRAAPLQVGYSPSELLMGRKLRTTVPIIRKQLVPHIPIRQRDEKEKQRQEISFNKRHRVQELPELAPGDIVGFQTEMPKPQLWNKRITVHTKSKKMKVVTAEIAEILLSCQDKNQVADSHRY